MVHVRKVGILNRHADAPHRFPASWLFGVLAALCTCLLGLGLARFAYTPLIPALIAAHWFTPREAIFLGAANIAGYLAGAVSARAVARRAGVRPTLRASMLVASLSLLACAQPASFAWFLVCRLASGLSGAALMVLAAPCVMPAVPVRHRGLAGGIIFTGIGIGVALSGTLLPVLMRGGLTQAWLALGVGGLAITAIAWCLLPPPPAARAAPVAPARLNPPLRAICVAYGVSAAGQVPGMLFLSDFVARGLHQGVASGAHAWAAFGLGALAGPLLAGAMADRIGQVPSLRGLWLLQIAATVALAAGAYTGLAPTPVIWLAGAMLGGGIPGLVVLVLGRTQALAEPRDEARGHAWSLATISFASGQAVGAYALSFLFARVPSYALLFALGAACMAVAFAAGEISRGREQGRQFLFEKKNQKTFGPLSRARR
jgi:predicted MFS family arabinose efflux permease